MEQIVKVLTELIINKTKNPYIRFILKKDYKQMKLKAYREFSIELFLHYKGDNKLVLKTSHTANTSGTPEDSLWKMVDSLFVYDILKWALSKEWENLVNEYAME